MAYIFVIGCHGNNVNITVVFSSSRELFKYIKIMATSKFLFTKLLKHGSVIYGPKSVLLLLLRGFSLEFS